MNGISGIREIAGWNGKTALQMIDSGFSPAQLAQPKLAQLASDIRLHHAQVLEATADCATAATSVLESAIKLGNSLIEAKKLVEHGLWEDWVSNHSGVPFASAQKYMRIASNLERVPLLKDAGGIREALALIADRKETDPKDKTSWPAYLHGIGKFCKALNFIGMHPVAQWPEDGRNQLRDDLLPLAKELWPDRFN